MPYIKTYDSIESGDIIRIKTSVYSDFIPSEKWQAHFITVNQFYKVVTISNNGNITAKDKAGNTYYHIYAADKNNPITAIYKPLKAI